MASKVRAPGFEELERRLSGPFPPRRNLMQIVEETNYDPKHQFKHRFVLPTPRLDFSSISVPIALNEFHIHLVLSKAFTNFQHTYLERACLNVGKMSRQSYYYRIISNLYNSEVHTRMEPTKDEYTVRNVFMTAKEKTNCGDDPKLFIPEEGKKQKMLLWLYLNQEEFMEYLSTGFIKKGSINNTEMIRKFGEGIWATECLTDLAGLWRNPTTRERLGTMYCVLVAVVMKNLYEAGGRFPTWPEDKSFPSDCDALRVQGEYRRIDNTCFVMKFGDEKWPLRMGRLRNTMTVAGTLHTVYKIKSPGQMRAMLVVELQRTGVKRIVPEFRQARESKKDNWMAEKFFNIPHFTPWPKEDGAESLV
ncbi:unnamed protein product [Bursaphelenchus xylophilus]|uniref:(pine wood nematode) hypothetical protein n=1 Tax=Bursaphelenchus xylophilus TaxID=6326 RepID=A0A1I7RZ93_BURXY|nr:unnamed protein product [Bursaphelenchus xylophilus]CAG9106713.1 unnamed protein product [Bursaphelenchus xylophilus]